MSLFGVLQIFGTRLFRARPARLSSLGWEGKRRKPRTVTRAGQKA